MNYLITTIKSWNINNAKKLRENDSKNRWEIITDKNDFTTERVKEISPRYIFVPHWSWMIPEEIWQNYETVVFHPADLPNGRGGTPIQNQIIRGIYETKLTAFRAEKEIDAGPIYAQRNFNMSKGNVDEILTRASQIYFNEMIPEIIETESTPRSQVGEIVAYKRRKPSQSELTQLDLDAFTPRRLYDFIRMLDGEGYPRAYIETLNGNLEFSNASLEGMVVRANIEIKSKQQEI
ncbi:MAG: formyltransferase family protein [Nanoarchaeota archaeon]